MFWGKKKVSFVADKPTPTRVKFKTGDGESVSFVAKKDKPQMVTFWAKKPGRKK